ncbi:MAG TPA: ATP-binding protein [Polyangiaceae bacterium]|nr:ATP-binding protein [Polyangiaceae bacterium]
MLFLNREAELGRLDEVMRGREGRLAVLHGRRRVGKTRLLLEWTERHGGLYTVADQSAPEVQRRYFAGEAARVFPGFADVEYPDWQSLFARLTREAHAAKWTGPLVIDELPYLALGSPELASVLQRWIDHDARRGGLKVALAGSSQRMMQGLVLSSSAPLYGRAHTLFEVRPLPARELRKVFRARSPVELCELYAAWGGVPRYWELAVDAGRHVMHQIDRLVLDPLGPLHGEPDRLLLEELPPAVEVRPILDAIGLGAHRLSEIAGRIGRPVTALGRPLQRLQEMGIVRRETPFGEPESKSKRSLYKIDDPFIRLWFRVVAPHRAGLLTSTPAERIVLLRKHWPGLAAAAFEELCRALLPRLDTKSALGRVGPWQAGSRWWQGNLPEWDLVSRSVAEDNLLAAEVKWSAKPFKDEQILRLARALAQKPLPIWHSNEARREVLRALFVTAAPKGKPRSIEGVHIVTAAELLR